MPTTECQHEWRFEYLSTKPSGGYWECAKCDAEQNDVPYSVPSIHVKQIEPFINQELGPKDWGTELLVAHTPHYTGKVLKMNAKATGPLQYHREKDETFYLHSGEARVYFCGADGKLGITRMTPGMSFHIPPGAVHRVEAVTDCVFFEASTPHFDDRVNVEKDFA